MEFVEVAVPDPGVAMRLGVLILSAEAQLLNAVHLYQRETGWHERSPDL